MRRARQELLQKGIDRELVEEILEEQAPDPREKLRKLWSENIRIAWGMKKAIAAQRRPCSAWLWI